VPAPTLTRGDRPLWVMGAGPAVDRRQRQLLSLTGNPNHNPNPNQKLDEMFSYN